MARWYRLIGAVITLLFLAWVTPASVEAQESGKAGSEHKQMKNAKSSEEPQNKSDADVPPVLSFKTKDIDGKDVELKQFLGSVILIVNTASKCGLTPQYAELQQLNEKYADQGLVILAFPSNEFGGQEPGNSAEIRQFCTDKYKVTFRLFEKVQVKTPETACELYKFLTDKKTNERFAGEIKWNFTKFLINRRGEVCARFEPREKPTDEKVIAKIEALLKEPAAKSTTTRPADEAKAASKEGGQKSATESEDAKTADEKKEKKSP